MKVYIYILSILFISSIPDLNTVYARTTYDNPSYNSDRDENLSSSLTHQKKRLVASEDAFHDGQGEEFERSGPLYEARFRKFDPNSFAHHDSRLEKSQDSFDEAKMQKRDFYDSSNAKDSSIEVILDPRAKKAVAVVENSPTGQAMYDLTGWKNKDENSFDSDQYGPEAQEQVVNLVYPAERDDRKYSQFDSSSDYSDKKIGFKDKRNERNSEGSNKKKRNAETKKEEKETEKRSTQEKAKRKSDQASQAKSDAKQSNECPPHNTPSSAENENKEKNEKTVKRETSQWTQEQLDALKNSLANVKDSTGEVQNLRNILSSMGLIDSQAEIKRDASNEEKSNIKREGINSDKKSDSEDEDLNEGNIILKRNNREISSNNEDVIKSEVEPVEKREASNSFEIEDSKKEIKRSENEAESNQEAKKEFQFRKKRQNSESKNVENKNETPSETEEDKTSDSKKYAKRDASSDSAKELRKNRENNETEEEYERRMESQIQAKIDAIKEKVKREILAEQKRRNKRESENVNTNIRKRRQSKEVDEKSDDEKAQSNVRRKRANRIPEKQMVYQAYQGDQDEEEEDGEFDDNAYDGRMYVEKRQAEEDSDYYDPVRKREVENYLRQYYPESRNRRSFDASLAEDSNAFHGSKRVLKNKNYADSQNQEEYNEKSNESNENSDSEYFGSLPQTYDGELTRYKRVKRDDPNK